MKKAWNYPVGIGPNQTQTPTETAPKSCRDYGIAMETCLVRKDNVILLRFDSANPLRIMLFGYMSDLRQIESPVLGDVLDAQKHGTRTRFWRGRMRPIVYAVNDSSDLSNVCCHYLLAPGLPAGQPAAGTSEKPLDFAHCLPAFDQRRDPRRVENHVQHERNERRALTLRRVSPDGTVLAALVTMSRALDGDVGEPPLPAGQHQRLPQLAHASVAVAEPPGISLPCRRRIEHRDSRRLEMPDVPSHHRQTVFDRRGGNQQVRAFMTDNAGKTAPPPGHR